MLLLTLTGCVGAGPHLVIVPARKGDHPEPLQAARAFSVPVFIETDEGTTVSQPLYFRAGVWIIDYDPTLPEVTQENNP